MPDKKASAAAFGVAALSVASLGVGLTLAASIGGDPADPTASAASARLGDAPGLLAAAEILKLTAAALTAVVVAAASRRGGPKRQGLLRTAALVGWLGVALLAGSGLAGFAGLLRAIPPDMAALWANRLGLASLGATGLWAAGASLSFQPPAAAPLWLRTAACLMALAGLAAVAAPPAALLGFVFGLAWWIGAGLWLRRSPA